MNYIENNTGNFEQVLWAIELKFLIPFFLIYVSYNTLNYPGFKFRLPCPARLGSSTIKRGTRVSSVVSYHRPWTAVVPCHFPQHSSFPFSAADRLLPGTGLLKFTLGLLKLVSSLARPKHRRDLSILNCVWHSPMAPYYPHTKHPQNLPLPLLWRLRSHYTSLCRSQTMACSFPWLWRELTDSPKARTRVFKS